MERTNQNVEQRPLLLRAGEVAKILGASRALVYRLMANGTVPVTRWGRSVRVPHDGLVEWISRNTTAGGGMTPAA